MGNMCELNDVVDFGDFFAPTSTDLVDGLLGQYRGMRARIETVAELIEGETAAAISYFLEETAARATVFRWSMPCSSSTAPSLRSTARIGPRQCS